jgi:hypothetical protein
MNPNPSPATRFQPGQSGNPAGRPAGSRNQATLVAESIIGEHLAEVVATGCRKAKEGSVSAINTIISRAVPPARRRTVMVDLPEVVTIADLPAAHARVTRLFAAGEITDEEAARFATVLEAHRRALEVADLDQRVAAVEETLGIGRG